MKHQACSFCTGLRYIEPASYVRYQNTVNQSFKDYINELCKAKKFVYYNEKVGRINVIEKCPKCGYVFTEEDYDSYTSSISNKQLLNTNHIGGRHMKYTLFKRLFENSPKL